MRECEHTDCQFHKAAWPGDHNYWECLDCGQTTTDYIDWEEPEDDFVERGRDPVW